MVNDYKKMGNTPNHIMKKRAHRNEPLTMPDGITGSKIPVRSAG